MSDELTRLLTETLRSRETDVEPMADLSARVLRKGRSARTRRHALGWGTSGVLAVAALVTAVVLGPLGQHPPDPGPAQIGPPAPAVTSPAVAVETGTDDPLWTLAGKLPAGPPLALIPRAERRGAKVVVVTADREVTLPAHTGFAFDLTSSAAGLLVAAHSDGFTGGGPEPDQALYLIGPDGRLTRLHKGPFEGLAVDPTGKRYAIAESAGIGAPVGTPAQITLASFSAPGKTVSHPAPTAAASLLGWTTQGLLLSDSSRTWLWEPGASSETELRGVVGASVLPTDPGRLLVATGKVDNPRTCSHLFTVRGRQLGPELTCGLGSEWTVSPDGRRAVIGSAVFDLADGSAGPELLAGLGTGFKHWEDSTHVLTQVFPAEPPQRQPVTSILVRCDVTTGACEEAPVKGSNGTSPVISW